MPRNRFQPGSPSAHCSPTGMNECTTMLVPLEKDLSCLPPSFWSQSSGKNITDLAMHPVLMAACNNHCLQSLSHCRWFSCINLALMETETLAEHNATNTHCNLLCCLPHTPQRNGAAVVKELIADAGRRSCLKSMNRDGATPLHLAVQAGLLDIVQLLVNAGSKVDATDRVRLNAQWH